MTMRRVALGALALTACAPTPAPQVEAGVTGKCDAAPVQDLLGRTRSEPVGSDALARSGAKALRWISPGMAVTMDYREDRLNLHVDEKDVVTKVICG